MNIRDKTKDIMLQKKKEIKDVKRELISVQKDVNKRKNIFVDFSITYWSYKKLKKSYWSYKVIKKFVMFGGHFEN